MKVIVRGKGERGKREKGENKMNDFLLAFYTINLNENPFYS